MFTLHWVPSAAVLTLFAVHTVAAPLHEAVRHGRFDETRRLLEAGASINAPDEEGRTPLMRGVVPEVGAFWSNPKKVNWLLEKGAEVNAKDAHGETALLIAAKARTDRSQAPVVKLLLEKGAHPNDQDAAGQTALMFAVAHQDPDLTHTLLDYGASVGVRDKQGRTALHIAVTGLVDLRDSRMPLFQKTDYIEPAMDILKALLAKSADVPAADKAAAQRALEETARNPGGNP